jgi:BlaI family transcriptional regulator, penicillinase repressor
MSDTKLPERGALSPLESRVMDIIWRRGEATADEVLGELGGGMTNATVRTLLRRIESKRYLAHRLEGRAFVYVPAVAASTAAQGALRRLARRFYGGSIEQLVQGLLDGRMINRRKLEKLAKRVDAAAKTQGKGAR